MPLVYFDASALVKRYAPEKGAQLVNAAFTVLPHLHMACSVMGVLEVVSILTRQHNDGRLDDALFAAARAAFQAEVIESEEFRVVPLSNQSAMASLRFITFHHLNATDAVVLRAALDLRDSLAAEDQFSFWSSDRRLLRAAAAEGLTTFDPEQDSIERLHDLLGIANRE